MGDLLGPSDGLAFGTAVGGPSAGAVICGVAGNDDDSDATIPFPEDDESLRQLGLVSFSGGVRTLDDTRYNNAGVTVGQLLGLERVGREARCWTSEDVAEWLPSIGAAFRQYKTVFVDNGVDGKFLLGIIGASQRGDGGDAESQECNSSNGSDQRSKEVARRSRIDNTLINNSQQIDTWQQFVAFLYSTFTSYLFHQMRQQCLVSKPTCSRLGHA